MEFALLTFFLVTAIVAGVYWLFVERTEAQEASHLRGRLRRSVQGGTLTKRLMNDPVRLSDVRALNQMLHRTGQMVAPLQRMIEQSGLKMTVGTLVLSCMVTAAVAFAVKTTSCVSGSASRNCSTRRRADSSTSVLRREAAESECGLPNTPSSSSA